MLMLAVFTVLTVLNLCVGVFHFILSEFLIFRACNSLYR